MPVLLILHIVICSLGYLLFGFASAVAYVYLRQERALKAKTCRLGARFRWSLCDLDRCLFTSLILGFAAMGFGLPMGIALQKTMYGIVDLASPRILLPALIWIFYLLILTFRLLTGLRGKIPSYMAVYGFHAVAISFVLELCLAAA